MRFVMTWTILLLPIGAAIAGFIVGMLAARIAKETGHSAEAGTEAAASGGLSLIARTKPPHPGSRAHSPA